MAWTDFTVPTVPNIAQIAAILGAGLAMGLGAIGPGFGLGRAAMTTLRGMARQPAADAPLFKNMLIAQAITETPAIFSLVISLMLYTLAQGQIDHADSWAAAAAYVSAGLCIGFGAIGSGVGSGMVGEGALVALARCPGGQGRVMMYMLMGQAWAQTGVIFALVVALMMLGAGGFDLLGRTETWIWSCKYVGAAVGMGLGAIGPSVGTAIIGAGCCRALVEAPDQQKGIRNLFFIGSATAQGPCIYTLVIALVMIAR